MARSLFRDTIMLRGPAGLIPMAGAEVRFYEPGTLIPIRYPLYPDATSGEALSVPYFTGVLGEVEVWSDEPHRARVIIGPEGYAHADEIIDIEPDPGTAASDTDVANAITAHEAKPDPHGQYLLKSDADLKYLSLSGGELTGDLRLTDGADIYLDGYFTKSVYGTDGLRLYSDPANTRPSVVLQSTTQGGQLEFGPGGGLATDTMLYRDGPGILYAQTDLRVERAVMVGGYFQSGLGYGAPYPASAGALRMRYGEAIAWRNSPNTANLFLSIDASDRLLWQGVPVLTQGSPAVDSELRAYVKRIMAVLDPSGPPPPTP